MRPLQWARAQLPDTGNVEIAPLRAEASFRSFFRIRTSGRNPTSVVLMISPPAQEQNGQFETLAGLFGSNGIPVPEILAKDSTAGWYLLSDLGELELADAYGTDHEPAAMEAAIRTLIRLQAINDPAVPPYTRERFADELGIFSEWFVRKLLRQQIPAKLQPVFAGLAARPAAELQCCVHRDYHCRNLLFDPHSGRLGVVDFQDALRGPVSYDLASLLHDCYHRFADADVSRWIAWYLENTPLDLDPVAFRSDLEHMAVQRQLKAVGIFTRLWLRDGRPTHLAHILPVFSQLGRICRRQPALAPLADWLQNLDADDIRRRIQAQGDQ